MAKPGRSTVPGRKTQVQRAGPSKKDTQAEHESAERTSTLKGGEPSQTTKTENTADEITPQPPLPDERLPEQNRTLDTAAATRDATTPPVADPPLPDEPVPETSTTPTISETSLVPQDPPLSSEPAPPTENEEPADDGWAAEWDTSRSAWFFHNRFTGVSQWENPRIAPDETAAAAAAAVVAKEEEEEEEDSASAQPPLPPAGSSIAGGYNPAIHGDWDPNADYAQAATNNDLKPEHASTYPLLGGDIYSLDNGDNGDDGDFTTTTTQKGALFNARTGKFQRPDQSTDRYGDEAKSNRQMNAFFDVDAAANSHDGRSLRAERQRKQPTRQELSQWKEKRKARKEEKRRAWLRD